MDEQTVTRAQHGDREAFADLVEAFGDRLHAVSQGILRDTSRAEDASQQALLQIWRDLPKLRDPSRFVPWAYRLTVRVCYAEAERTRRTMHASIDELQRQPAAGDQTAWVADRDELERAFGQLSLDHRTVVVMRHYLGLPLEQIAEALAVPVDTVRSRLYHAMRGLRAAIEADERSDIPATASPEVLT
jgi:RNA polymerase sigma-70 factor (ECF subfamily)